MDCDIEGAFRKSVAAAVRAMLMPMPISADEIAVAATVTPREPATLASTAAICGANTTTATAIATTMTVLTIFDISAPPLRRPRRAG